MYVCHILHLRGCTVNGFLRCSLIIVTFSVLLFLIVIDFYLSQANGCFRKQEDSFCQINNMHPASIDRLTASQWLERYKSAMVLGGCADAIGYKNGEWEFMLSGPEIHNKVKWLGGISSLKPSLPDWMVSDDTVMHLATAEAIAEYGKRNVNNTEDLLLTVAKHYKHCMLDMSGRSAGLTSIAAVEKLHPERPKGYIIPFNKKGGGCGAAMRSMCIGLYYPSPEQMDDLIALSIETGRMTHNHPTGYLGSLASALFTHFAIQGYPMQSWGARLVETLDKAWKYVESQGRDVEENRESWFYFSNSWKNYLKLRGIEDGFSMPQFPDVYDVKERDAFYKSISFNGWGGASGHDAPMIAYDALLGAGNNWEKLAERAFFHGGDSDSTAIIAATCYGILYGYEGVPTRNFMNIEYKKRLEDVGREIFDLVSQKFPQ